MEKLPLNTVKPLDLRYFLARFLQKTQIIETNNKKNVHFVVGENVVIIFQSAIIILGRYFLLITRLLKKNFHLTQLSCFRWICKGEVTAA